ncbi:hypothetical protein M8818_001436 [Zalaria obscura]|uniref:Uncharacterized protein n=1 Tax=Zalaria obscura TaxID=2024903 RepID=A0ACC3SKV4_9PEZI
MRRFLIQRCLKDGKEETKGSLNGDGSNSHPRPKRSGLKLPAPGMEVACHSRTVGTWTNPLAHQSASRDAKTCQSSTDEPRAVISPFDDTGQMRTLYPTSFKCLNSGPVGDIGIAVSDLVKCAVPGLEASICLLPQLPDHKLLTSPHHTIPASARDLALSREQSLYIVSVHIKQPNKQPNKPKPCTASELRFLCALRWLPLRKEASRLLTWNPERPRS